MNIIKLFKTRAKLVESLEKANATLNRITSCGTMTDIDSQFIETAKSVLLKVESIDKSLMTISSLMIKNSSNDIDVKKEN